MTQTNHTPGTSFPNPAPRPAGGRPRGHDRGFSLVELMVAITVTLILLGGVLQLFVSSKQTYRTQEALSRLQENGRAAISLLQRDIRQAGYQGCRSMADPDLAPNVIANAPMPTTTIDASNIVRGYDGGTTTWSPTPPTTLSTLARTGTDIISLIGSGTCSANPTKNMTATNANIQLAVANTCNFTADQVLIISDCTQSDVFRATSVSNSSGDLTIAHSTATNSSNFLSKNYQRDAEVMTFSAVSYYIADGADGRPSLWRLDQTQSTAADVNPLELVSGIQDMQILYGQDSDADGVPNFYVPASEVTDWAGVVAVRISLLAETPDDNVGDQAQTYTFNGTTTTASDRRIYRVFTTTITLRNKVS